MSGRGLLSLAVLALLVLGGALYVIERQAPEGRLESRLLFPELAGRLNAVEELSIRTYDQHITMRKSRRGNWELPERGDYPADFNSVRSLLLALSEARIQEYKTDNPTLYPKLGIQGIESETSPSIRLVVRARAGNLLVDLILGHLKTSAVQSGLVVGARSYYARLPDDARGLLVRGDLDVSRQVRDWLDGLILDIAEARIRDIRVVHPDMEVHVFRTALQEPDFNLSGIPEGKELKSQTQLNRMGAILSELRIDDVASAGEYEFGAAAVQTRVETFDGLAVESRAEYVDGTSHAAFTFTTLEDAGPEQQQEAAQLNDRLSPWVFQVPFHKYDTLARKIGPLIQDIDIDSPEPDASLPPLTLPDGG